MRKLALNIGIAAIAVAFQGANAAEFGPPYEQLDVDRALPNLAEQAPAQKGAYGTPFEDVELDRALPQFPERSPRAPSTRGAPHEDLNIDRMWPSVSEPAIDGGASGGATSAGSPWDDDPYFVAPPM